MESCNKSKEKICAKKEKDISIVKRREKVCELINKQLRKEYIRPSKLPQTTLVFFVEKKNSKKHMI